MHLSRKVVHSPRYAFDILYSTAERARAKGIDVINLGAGMPDLPPPGHVTRALVDAIDEPSSSQYPPSAGEGHFLEAVATYYRDRFGVELSPEEEIVALHGSKVGMSRLPLAILDPGQVALVPDPAYPVYSSAVHFASGMARLMPLVAANGYLPDIGRVEAAQRDTPARLMFLNYPNVPTGVVAQRSQLASLIKLGLREDIAICNDAAYCDIYYTKEPPPSLLEVDGAMEVGVEFGTLSNTYQVPGWRIGYAVGSRRIIKALKDLEAHLDSGLFRPLQRAGSSALTGSQECVARYRSTYRRRRDLVVLGLTRLGYDVLTPEAACYVWARVPLGAGSSEVFCANLLEQCGVLVLAGTALGHHGEGFFRVSLTAEDEVLEEALRRLEVGTAAGARHRSGGIGPR